MALPALIAGILGRMAAGSAASAAGGAAARAAAGAAAGGANTAALQAGQRAANGAAQANQRFVQSVQAVEARTQAAQGQLSGLAATLGHKLAHGITAAVDAISAMAGPIENLVRLANPAKAQRFTIALEDAYAVIGRMLIPVLDGLTAAARKVGDYYAGLEPVIGPVLTKVGELVERFFTRLVEVGQKNAPVLEMMADLLVKVGDAALKAVDLLFKAVDKVFSRLPRWVARQLGYTPENSRFNPAASSMGAAARPAAFVGAKAIADEAIKNALTLQATGQKAAKPPEKTLENIEGQLSDFFGWAKGKGGGSNPYADPKLWTKDRDPFTSMLGQALRQLATSPF